MDVEDYFHVSVYNGVIDRNQWESLPSRVEQNTARMLALLDDVDTKGTFFVLGWVAERYPKIVRDIAGAGHEVACHGLSHKLIFQQERDVFAEECRRAKYVLEDITGAPVNGYRGATFSITSASLWALDILAETGFTFDSSIFPVRHDRYGIPSAPKTPFRYKGDNQHEITEFPMTTKNVLGWQFPVSGGGYFRIYPYPITKWALKSLNRQKQSFVFYVHPWELDPDQPFWDAGRLSNLRHRTNLKRCEQRLRRLLGDFRFSTMSNVLADMTLPVQKSNGTAFLNNGQLDDEVPV